MTVGARSLSSLLRFWRHWLFGAASLLVLLGAMGLLVALSGMVPVTASSGHFAVTEWLLQLAKKRSVRTHALGVAALSFDAPWLAAKGAGHFESACRPCHGAPDLLRPPAVVQTALPPPPSLTHAALEWRPEELLYIVKHGIKMTGMPAWPTQVRDDEVHAMVAFLRELPRLDAAEYRRLAQGDAESDRDAEPLEDLVTTEPPSRTVSAGCARCHGPRGGGRRAAAYPKLAGQGRDYLARSLEAYAIGARPSGMMQPIAAALSGDDIAKLADHYAGEAPRSSKRPERQPDPAAVERGRAIAERGIPERDVPSCVDCHDPPGPANSEVPTLHGQFDEYLALQLELFARGVRGGTDRADLMAAVAPKLRPPEMRDVALYYSTLR